MNVPAAGAYQMELDSTPANVGWASPFDIQVNDAPATPAVLTQVSQVTPEIRRHEVAGVFSLSSGLNRISFVVDTPRELVPQNYTLFLDAFRLIPAQAAIARIGSAAPLNVFESGDAVTLDVTMDFATGADASIAYTVTDYFDAVVAQGTATAGAFDGIAHASLGSLPIGHYRISAQYADDEPFTEEFSVVTADSERERLTDSPFGIDVAAAWIAPAAKYEELAAGLARTGVTWLRDRTHWSNTTNPGRDQFNLDSESGANAFFADASEQGLRILSTYHNAPSWTRSTGDLLPSDLLASYAFAKEAADFYSDEVDGWELWNEPDHNSFTAISESPDRYAAFVKAAAIGMLDSGRKPLTVAGAFANPVTAYATAVAANDVYDYVDVYGYHAYSQVDGTPIPQPWSAVPGHVALSDAHGTATTRNWMTESGTFPVVANPGDRLTPEMQRKQARGYISNTLLSLAAGTDKQFLFVAPPYSESGGKYFGLLTPAFTPNAVFTAEAALTAALGEGAYVGAIPGVPAGVNALAFDDGDDQVVALWSETAAQVTLDLGSPLVTSTDIVGAATTLQSADGIYSLTAGPDVVYLRMQGHQVITGGSSLRPSAATVTDVTLSPAQRVVVNQRYPDEISANAKNNGYSPSIDESTEIVMEVTNLNSTAMTGTAQVTVDGGWIATVSNPGLSLPAWSSIEVPVALEAGPTVAAGSRSTITMSVDFADEQTSVSVATLTVPGTTSTVARHVSTDSGGAIRVTRTNDSDTAERITGATLTVRTDPVSASAVDLDTTIPPGASADLTVPLPDPLRDATGDYDYVVRLDTTAADDRPVGGVLKLLSADQFATVSPAETMSTGAPTASLPATTGLGGDLWFGWTADALVVKAEIADDVHYQPASGANIWQADSIQVAIGAGLPGESTSAGSEYGAALGTSGVQVFQWRGMDGKSNPPTSAVAQVRRDDSTATTSYQLSIPWSELAPVSRDDGLLSLSVAVNDADDANGRSFTLWGGGITDAKDSSKFRAARIVSSTGARDDTPPTITGLPEDGAVISDSTVFDIAAVDPESGVSSLSVRIDGAEVAAEQPLSFTGRPGPHVISVQAANADGLTSSVELSVLVYADEGSGFAPASAALSSDNGWDTGLDDGDYTITVDLWWGVNASAIMLFENGERKDTVLLTPRTPTAQSVPFHVSGKHNGDYVYTAVLVNESGETTSAPLTVHVTDAAPGAPVVRIDNSGGDGTYTVTADLWWGTNATTYRLYENDVLIDEGSLIAASPRAQHAETTVVDRAPGVYNYRAEFANDSGTTSSSVAQTTVHR
ncbi:hypothetical protein IF188_10270 [Microbacterium sp. NEAU-LLC]|uniref:Carbohydrate-binding domain-containing protein n=1 Tax=Microbacterium helvum TaxID=2773713 RepID=A0ABR8NR86_9MICO|nr:sugar-binding protein [Microbacterium helvum]MBD3942081.1 hypothetical protein [Microbacterium helvum]